MYIRSALQFIAERHHQNPILRCPFSKRLACFLPLPPLFPPTSYQARPRRCGVVIHPYSPTFSPRFSCLPTRFRLCGASIRIALALRSAGISHTSLPFLCSPTFPLSPSSYCSLSTPVDSFKLSFTFHTTKHLFSVSSY